MAVSAFSSLRTKIRKALRDAHGLLYNDTALDGFINEAQREYALKSGSLVCSFEVNSTDDGVFSAPADFFAPVKFIGADNLEKPFYSWRYLNDLYPDFRRIAGSCLRGIVSDFDGFGKFRIFPKLPENAAVGTFYYQRFPVQNVLETTNEDAILQHALFQAFLLQDNSTAADCYDRFTEAVYTEQLRSRGLKMNSPVRRGRFF